VAAGTRNIDRREDALSRERIVAAAVEMLDRAGEDGLTFRALSAHLKTGAGAIYWHVANKSELLVAATDAVLADATTPADTAATPREAIRAVAIGVFDAIEAHPWAGTQLSRISSQPAVLRIFERIGQQVQALGVPAGALFDAASALLNYILGVAGQNAALAREVAPGTNRAEFLETVAGVWANLDPDAYPFTRTVVAQYLAGIDLILAGIAGLREATADEQS
jgi:AcrR family transcriptional regulator